MEVSNDTIVNKFAPWGDRQRFLHIGDETEQKNCSSLPSVIVGNVHLLWKWCFVEALLSELVVALSGSCASEVSDDQSALPSQLDFGDPAAHCSHWDFHFYSNPGQGAAAKGGANNWKLGALVGMVIGFGQLI